MKDRKTRVWKGRRGEKVQTERDMGKRQIERKNDRQIEGGKDRGGKILKGKKGKWKGEENVENREFEKTKNCHTETTKN